MLKTEVKKVDQNFAIQNANFLSQQLTKIENYAQTTAQGGSEGSRNGENVSIGPSGTIQ